MNSENMAKFNCMKRLINYIIISFAPVILLAQSSVPVWSLDTILARIDRGNIGLQSYQLEAESYKYRADAATAWMAPMVGAGTFMTPYPGEKAMGPAERGNIMFEVEQEIPNPAKLKAKRNYIRSQGAVVASQRGIALNELRSSARSNYYEWLVAKNKLRLLQDNEKIFSTLKKIEEVRYPYNKSQLSGIYKVTAKLEENKNMVRMQESVVARSRAVLLTLMNEDNSTIFDIDSIADAHFVPELIEDTAVIASSRSDVGQVDNRIRSMMLNIESMRKERKPDFRIRFDHMSPVASVMPKAFSVMGMVSIPIAPWASRMYKSEIKAMEYSISSMEKERQGMLVSTKGMLRGMQEEIQGMHDRVIAMEEKIIPALQKAMDANYLLYQENKLSIDMVLDSWEALNMMRMNLLDETLKHYKMIIEYDKILYK
jgi:outer membrane protein, heavy metal efflux system